MHAEDISDDTYQVALFDAIDTSNVGGLASLLGLYRQGLARQQRDADGSGRVGPTNNDDSHGSGDCSVPHRLVNLSLEKGCRHTSLTPLCRAMGRLEEAEGAHVDDEGAEASGRGDDDSGAATEVERGRVGGVNGHHHGSDGADSDAAFGIVRLLLEAGCDVNGGAAVRIAGTPSSSSSSVINAPLHLVGPHARAARLMLSPPYSASLLVVNWDDRVPLHCVAIHGALGALRELVAEHARRGHADISGDWSPSVPPMPPALWDYEDAEVTCADDAATASSCSSSLDSLRDHLIHCDKWPAKDVAAMPYSVLASIGAGLQSPYLYYRQGGGHCAVLSTGEEEGAADQQQGRYASYPHSIDLRDTYGLTPMHAAVVYSKTEAVRHLLEHGADVNNRVHGEYDYLTPLATACRWYTDNAVEIDIVQMLLDSGADADTLVAGPSQGDPWESIHSAVTRAGKLEAAAMLRRDAHVTIEIECSSCEEYTEF